MSNESIRIDLMKFLNEKGIMQNKVAKTIGCSPTTINLFLHNKRDISKKYLLAIHQYINANK